MSDQKKIALIDGYGFVFRAYHSLPPLTRSDKTPVGAVYGFTNMLIKLLAGLDVSHLAVVFDAGSKTFRNDIYPEYKANRPPCPEDLKPQFPIIREAAESLNLQILEKIGVEADDIIASIAKKYSKEGFQVLIVSSDKDLMQLIDDNIFMYDAMKNKFITKKEVNEKFSVNPDRVLDILSLMGDASDNIPGVRGIGPKGAAELINEFGTLENIFLNLDKIKQNKRREYLENGEKNAKLSKSLISLKYDVEINLTAEDFKIKNINPHKLVEFLTKQGFRSLISRIKKEFNIEGLEASEKKNLQQDLIANNISYKDIKNIEITNDEIAENIVKKVKKNGFATIDFIEKFTNKEEKNKQKPEGELAFISISTTEFNESISEIYYLKIPQQEISKSQDLFDLGNEVKITNKEIKYDFLKEILEDEAIKKIIFDSKKLLKKFNFKSYEDVQLINHLINSSIKNDLRQLIDLNLSEDFEGFGFGELFEEKKFIKEENEEKKLKFLYFRNFAIYQLYRILRPKIFTEKLNEAYLNYEIPLLNVLSKMENEGIKIDAKILHDLSEEFGKKIEELSKKIYNIANEEFNIASPKQIGEILFDKLGLESKAKSKKTGALSTGAKILEKLAVEGHEIANLILEHRKYSKLKNTYTDSLPKEINKNSNRVHSNFSTISTITGRLSSSNPNLQNIPIKTKEGKKIRKGFIAQKGYKLISADYSQIELRVIAHVAKIESLKQAFKEEKDIHKITASQVFKTPEEEVSRELRSKAKAINFGIIYGISNFGLAKQLKISNQEAGDYIKNYLETYPGIEQYMIDSKEIARKQGFVQTFSGRKCFIPEINSKNFIIKSEAERLAINAPIQGSAADIIKKAMINLHEKLVEEKMKSKIILQIHDELIIESPDNEVEKAAIIIKEIMEKAFTLDVPLKVDLEIGESWN